MNLVEMKKYVWFICFLFDLCFVENGVGCCGNIGVDGFCRLVILLF